MKHTHISISDSEWVIMKVLWQSAENGAEGLSLKEIDEAIGEADWSYTTVRTMVGRLVEKGAIRADKTNSRNFTYFPAVSEELCRKAEVKSMVDKIFDGSAKLMVSSLVEDRGLTEEEQRTLLAIIEKMG